MRSLKSDEEIALLEKASVLGDKMLQACRDRARPGVRESEVYGHMMEAMLADGGEEPTFIPVGLRSLSISAPIPASYDPSDGTARRHHLRNSSQDRRVFLPMSNVLSAWASRTKSCSAFMTVASLRSGAAWSFSAQGNRSSQP